MFDRLFSLILWIDILSGFKMLWPTEYYDGESFYWRWMGLILLAPILAVLLLPALLHITLILVATVLLALWLIVHLFRRYATCEEQGVVFRHDD